MNETHDSSVRSWVASANQPDTDFPVQNLPFGVFRRPTQLPSIGVAIGDHVFDAGSWVRDGNCTKSLAMLALSNLNSFLEAGRGAWSEARKTFFNVLREGSARREAASRYLIPQTDVEMLIPIVIGGCTDFYASIFHATNVGSMFRPDNPLLPNYKWVPIGYHGRASSIVVSGTPVRRPQGQTKPPDKNEPTFGPTKQLDYE